MVNQDCSDPLTALYGRLPVLKNLVQSPVLSCPGSPSILDKILHVGFLSGSGTRLWPRHGIMQGHSGSWTRFYRIPKRKKEKEMDGLCKFTLCYYPAELCLFLRECHIQISLVSQRRSPTQSQKSVLIFVSASITNSLSHSTLHFKNFIFSTHVHSRNMTGYKFRLSLLEIEPHHRLSLILF